MFTSDKGACRENCNDFLKVKKRMKSDDALCHGQSCFYRELYFRCAFFATLTSDLKQVDVNTESLDHMTTLDYSESVLLHGQ
jgi:hypothetical protein